MSALHCPHCGKHPIREHTLEERRACRKAHRAQWIKKRPVQFVSVQLDTLRSGGGAHFRILPAGAARDKMAASRGGTMAHLKGTIHKFTSETARAAALSRPRGKATGGMLGRRSKQRPTVPRAPLRARYAAAPGEITVAGIPLSIRYDAPTRTWWQTSPLGTQTILEGTALRKLGHLPKTYRRSNGVPVAMTPITVRRRTRVW